MGSGQVAHRLACGVLGVWLGAVVMSGVVAAVAFPIMKGLAPTLPDYHVPADEHWLIAAGAVARRVFNVLRFVEIACLALAVAAVSLGRRSAPARGGAAVWIGRAALLGAVAALVWGLALQSRMQDAIDAYWSAAKAGQVGPAADHRDAFRAMHPASTMAMGLRAACVLVALVATAASAHRPIARGAHERGATP